MFGSRRRKAVKDAIENTRPLIGILQNFYGIPAGFWDDEFVIGFFGFMIGFHLNESSGGSLSQTDKGYALVESFTSLSNMNGQVLARRFCEFDTSNSKDFEKGLDNADMITSAVSGTPEGIQKAKRILGIDNLEIEYKQIIRSLTVKLFIDEVSKRFLETDMD